MSLMQEIRAFPVPRDHVALWWFGQNGYIFKSPEGTLAAVDLYLTDSCVSLGAPIDVHRQVPIFVKPEDVDVDLYLCTHNHQDHTDPETIRGLRHKDTMQFIGPMPSCDTYRAEQVEESRIVPMWAAREWEFRDLKLRAAFAMPTDDTDLNHLGYVFQFGNGPKIYMTGDTDYCELLSSVRKQEPDLAITCINGGWNNLSHWEAARLMAEVKPRVAIPCHYDMFPDNSINPQQFRATLALQAPEVRYQELRHAEPFLFTVK